MSHLPDADPDHAAEGAKIIRVRDLIALWPSRQALADDLRAVGSGGDADDVSVERVHKWAKRGVIPSIYHARLLRAAARRGLDLTADQVVAAHDAAPATYAEDAA